MIADRKPYFVIKRFGHYVGAKDLSPLQSQQMNETEGLLDAIVGEGISREDAKRGEQA